MSNFNLEHLFKYIKEKQHIVEGSPNQDGYHSFRVLKKMERRRFESFNKFRAFSRACNIDVAPKVLFSKSVSVTELINSGVSNYLEFQNVTDTFFYSSSA